MDRRNFIRLAGGGTVAAIGVGATSGCSLSPAMPAAALTAWQGPGAETEPRRRAVAYAITAPNPHNRQPWLVDLREPGVITLSVDRERLLPETDPLGRQILIGQGTFLELLVMALAQDGWRADVTLWPQGEQAPALKDWAAKPVARLQLVRGATPDPLFAQILKRHTTKVVFDTARPVAPGTLQALVDGSLAPAGPAGAMRLAGTVDVARVASLRALCSAANDVELLTPRTVMESLRLTRVGPTEIERHRDGISINAPMARFATAVGLFDRSAAPAKGSSGFDQMKAFTDKQAASAMGYVWLTSPGNSRSQQVEAGRAYMRLALKACELGVGLHPMSQALQEFPEMAVHYEKAHQLLIGKPAPKTLSDETVQMFCRLGFAAGPVPAAPRRPARDLLVV